MIGWLKKLISARARVEQGTGTKWLSNIIELLNGPKSASGVYVNEDKAMSVAAVFTAVRIIAGEIGALPLHVYRRTDTGGRESAVRHWAYPLLHDAPNEYHTSMIWRELLIGHILLWGNHYSRVEWIGNGSANAVYPLMPWDVKPRLTSRGAKFYQVSLPDGKEDLPDDEVIHVPGYSYDGLCGLSVVGKMRDSLGEAIANDEFAGAFFANGAKLGGILEVPGKMKEEASKRLVASIAERFTGKDGAFGTMVLEEGAKWHGPTTMPLRDAQFLEGRKFKRSEIFGWYGLPPHLGGDTERQTTWGTGIEQMDIGFAKHTITPLCVRVEQELNRKLFRRGSGYYCKHNLDALMRGDFKSRMEGYQIAVGRPFLSVNEVRELEDWDRRAEKGYDDIALPLNTGTGAEPPAPAEPKPVPAAQE